MRAAAALRKLSGTGLIAPLDRLIFTPIWHWSLMPERKITGCQETARPHESPADDDFTSFTGQPITDNALRQHAKSFASWRACHSRTAECHIFLAALLGYRLSCFAEPHTFISDAYTPQSFLHIPRITPCRAKFYRALPLLRRFIRMIPGAYVVSPRSYLRFGAVRRFHI